MGRTNPNCGQYILIHLMKPFWCTFTLMKVPSLASWASVSLGREINTFSSQVQWSVSQPMLWVALVSSTAFLELFSIFTNSLESKNLEVELLNYCQMTKKKSIWETKPAWQHNHVVILYMKLFNQERYILAEISKIRFIVKQCRWCRENTHILNLHVLSLRKISLWFLAQFI